MILLKLKVNKCELKTWGMKSLKSNICTTSLLHKEFYSPFQHYICCFSYILILSSLTTPGPSLFFLKKKSSPLSHLICRALEQRFH